jgi:hypothetical protein
VIDEIVTDDAIVIKKEAGISPEEDKGSGETDGE